MADIEEEFSKVWSRIISSNNRIHHYVIPDAGGSHQCPEGWISLVQKMDDFPDLTGDRLLVKNHCFDHLLNEEDNTIVSYYIN